MGGKFVGQVGVEVTNNLCKVLSSHGVFRMLRLFIGLKTILNHLRVSLKLNECTIFCNSIMVENDGEYSLVICGPTLGFCICLSPSNGVFVPGVRIAKKKTL